MVAVMIFAGRGGRGARGALSGLLWVMGADAGAKAVKSAIFDFYMRMHNNTHIFFLLIS